MRRVGRSGTGWLGFAGLPDEVADHPWSIARRAAQDAGRDPDALKTAMRINPEPGTSVDLLVRKLTRFAGSGIDEAFVDAFAVFPSLDQMLDFASQVIAPTCCRRSLPAPRRRHRPAGHGSARGWRAGSRGPAHSRSIAGSAAISLAEEKTRVVHVDEGLIEGIRLPWGSRCR
jgi:alkanesulfonate monooxygenase SsuD/methylene tetrahydromethanopterin reductase-like flavin-dependent oxidoreductase (luciferase family)